MDAAAAPTGRPEAEESGSMVRYRTHCFIPVRGEHSWGILTSPCYFLLLKARRMLNSIKGRQGVLLLSSQVPSFLSWVQEAPTQTEISWVAAVPGSAPVGAGACGCSLGQEHLGVMQPPPTSSLSDAAEPSRWEESVSADDAVRRNGDNCLSSPSARALTVFFSLYSYACASPHKLFAPPITYSLKFPFATLAVHLPPSSKKCSDP